MTSSAFDAAAVLTGYLFGSIPFGLVLARLRGLDIREHGSGNIGATNVARNLGKKLGLLVLLLDAAKGALPVLAARWLGLEPSVIAAVAWAAIAGHCFPVWLRFRGGKGVATTLGALVALEPLATAIALGVFFLIFLITRIVAAGSIGVAVALPLAVLLHGTAPDAVLALTIALGLLIIVRHRGNIARMLRGEET